MFSQNNEEQIIREYFKDSFENVTLLDIGANDGVTLSNSRFAIMQGASAVLIEPSPIAFKNLKNLYKTKKNVYVGNCAISDQTGQMDFYNTSDPLVASLIESEAKKWHELGVKYDCISIDTYTFNDLLNIIPYEKFDLILIDAEGVDYVILSQIDLKKIGAKMVIVEWNSKCFEIFDKYFIKYGFELHSKNAENLIYVVK